MPSECPPPTTWALDLALPATWAPGQVLQLVIAPGWSRASGGICAHVEGRTIAGAETSPTAAIVSAPECLAVPEPPPAALLAGGLVLVALLARLRRRST